MKSGRLDAICAALSKATESVSGDAAEAASPADTPAPLPLPTASKRKNFRPIRSDKEPLILPVPAPKQEEDDNGSLKELEIATTLALPRELGQPPCEGSPVPSLDTALASANPAVEHYILRFTGPECGAPACSTLPPAGAGREHFHCKHCRFRLIPRREDMLRHYKWHRKREESLSHGFMRYAASESCVGHFGSACPHALRQTHYHCLQPGCDKVYISTSDVQMHANSHRKAAHIAREGFQRFKASESCGYPDCPFSEVNHRTTHFHCLRPGCTHSFKNKADMDKHKAHHLRDEALARDGFRKWLKSDVCSFPRCPFSRQLNHIHCIRPGCDYVLHSTSQMYSHKRKHEKLERGDGNVSAPQPSAPAALLPFHQGSPLRIKHYDPESQQFYSASNSPAPDSGLPAVPALPHPGAPEPAKLRIKLYDPATQGFVDEPGVEVEASKVDETDAAPIDLNIFQQPFNLPLTPLEDDPPLPQPTPPPPPPPPKKVSSIYEDVKTGQADKLGCIEDVKKEKESKKSTASKWAMESWQKYITRYTANDPCVPHCALMYKDHYHCTSGEGCGNTFRGKEGVREHARQHQLLDTAATHFATQPAGRLCPRPACPATPASAHFHCKAPGCPEVVSPSEGVFRRLEHFKVHEYADAAAPTDAPLTDKKSSRRKSKDEKEEENAAARRGRPRTVSSPQGRIDGLIPGGKKVTEVAVVSPEGLTAFRADEPCPDLACKYSGRPHWHCSSPRCYFASATVTTAESHAQDFHGSLEIPEGFACFDREVACAFGAACPHSAKSRHFHCLRPACPEAFLKVNALAAHAATHPPLSPSPASMAADPAASLAKALMSLPSQPYSVEQNCGRPFCKLKRRVHYHCSACGQGFSKASRLLPHLHTHGLTLPPALAGATLMGELPTSLPIPFSAPVAAPTSSPMPVPTLTAATVAGLSQQQAPTINPAALFTSSTFSQSIESLKASIAASAGATGGGGKMKFHVFQPQLLKAPTTGSADGSSRRLFEESPIMPNPAAFAALLAQHVGQPTITTAAPTTSAAPTPTPAPPAPTPTKKSKRKASVPAAASPGPRKFKFVDCTADAVAAVEAANRMEDVAPEGFARFGARSDCGLGDCALNGLLHYHCLHPPCRGIAIPDKSEAPAHLASHNAL